MLMFESLLEVGKKYESLGRPLDEDSWPLLVVAPFMITDNGFGDSERAGEIGPIGPKWPFVFPAAWPLWE